MNKLSFKIIISLFCFSLIGFSAFAETGEELYGSKLCVTCHGPQGKEPIAPIYPTLAGQSKDYILSQTKEIKSGDRSNGLSSAMQPMVANVSNEEMAKIADYLSGLSSKGSKQKKKAVRRGKKSYVKKACDTCHGKNGQSPSESNYPILAGQTVDYLIGQYTDIIKGKRNSALSKVMVEGLKEKKIKKLKKKDLKNIAAFLSSKGTE